MLIAIIPAKEEENNIGEVVRKTNKYVDFVLVIDDASLDNTKKVAEENGAFVIRNPVNLGKADALKVGFKYAIDNNFETIALLDGDGQHDPDELPKFIKKMDERRGGLLFVFVRCSHLVPSVLPHPSRSIVCCI